MSSIHAHLSGSSFPPEGLRVTARFEAGKLRIEAAGPLLELDPDQLIVSVGGFEEPQLYLNWLDANGKQAALQALAEADIAALLATAPAPLQAQLQQQWRQRGRQHRQVWGWLGGLAGAALLLGALAWWQAPRAAAWLAGLVPVAVEEKLGLAVLAQVRAQGGLLDSGAAQQAVQRIGADLTRGSRYQYRWFVKKDASVNAFAMPGGYVVVHTGLLEQAAGPTELAAVLAHEVQHIEQRHSLKQMIGALGWGALLSVTLGDVSGVAAPLAHQAGTLYFSRDMEEEADRLGFQALLRAHISPDGMLTFFQKLEKTTAGAAALPAWASSHPQTGERIERIRALIAQQPCPPCRPLDGDWRAVVGSLGAAK
ncbi:M48 family metallopeptidase [Janthinobacterium fluminis]|uniref:M48 family metallopeptidase n=1 Tax=Janthinobacterium fluminis TaxID=2987524 RepID=A0ABT5K735_9BURK|nr:M48 family metallopeptidase [Janthinobacterium fluminis]MDC8760823.1 M48 family metallopeptidase [Janthinobacterium fluminis]